MKKSLLLGLAASAAFALSTASAQVTWTGADYTWTQPDANSFNATYNSGSDVAFGNTGITDGTTGKTAIVISGTLNPDDVTFNQTGARIGGAGGSSGNSGFNYLFTSTGTANVINASGNLTLNGGNTLFRANTTVGTYNHTFAGALNYTGGVMLGISSSGATVINTVTVGSLAAPTGAGNSILFNAIDSASGFSTSGFGWSATTNRLIVTGAKPTVANGMVSAGIQYYAGNTANGEFMTFDGNNLIAATAGYTSYATDWSGAASTEIVNLTASTTLTGSGTMSVYALRNQSGNQNLGGRTVALGSGGMITAGGTISNGTLDFGSAGYLGAYNPSGGFTISANIAGSNGLTILGASGGMSLTSASNTFTGGLFINGGTVILATAANALNGNNVTLNGFGSLALNVANAVIGGLSGTGDVAANPTGSTARNLNVSPTSGSHTFDGVIRNGAGGAVLSITKQGAGAQSFSSSSTASYTGTTTVSAGTLLVNTTIASAAAVTVNGTSGSSLATLGGSGTITGATTIGSFGVLAPGNSPGVLTFSNGLSLGGATNMELNSTVRGTGFDGINITTGALAYGGTMSLTFGSAFVTGDTTFDLFNIGGTQSGTFTSIASSAFYTFTLNSGNGYSANDQLGNTWSFNHTTGDLSVVPEPTTWALLVGSLTALMVFRRRRQS